MSIFDDLGVPQNPKTLGSQGVVLEKTCLRQCYLNNFSFLTQILHDYADFADSSEFQVENFGVLPGLQPFLTNRNIKDGLI
ncbi:MAG: hypothetical protein HQL68_12760 [Magnetococcales bacterium]|nr:hypothetical protein [Magnetococcales bacterium]